MKILIVTNTAPTTINHIVDAFENNKNLEIEVLHQLLKTHPSSLKQKIAYKLKLPLDLDKCNHRVVEAVSRFKPDIVFIIKGNVIHPSALKKIKQIKPKIKLISWSLDDMYAWHNRSLYYTFGLKYYDIVFTTKSYNLNELKQLGANRVEFLYQAYSKKYHIPCSKCETSEFNFDVLFIGAAETERVQSLSYLASNGIKVYIYGGGWDKKRFSNLHPNLIVHKYDLVGSDYSEAISCSKISLCFLRKMNRDLHTSRSIEIPACGGFMLAERTDEHLELFKEDKEAVYFSNNYELLEKVTYYLTNENERINIIQNSLNRCIISGYSYDDMVIKIMKKIHG